MNRIVPAVLSLRNSLRRALSGPPLLAFLPALVLGAFWLGGEGWLLALSLGLPLLFAAVFGLDFGAEVAGRRAGPVPLSQLVDQAWSLAKPRQQRFGLFLLRLDDLPALIEHHGSRDADQILDTLETRLAAVLRQGDQILRCPDGEFAVLTAPVQRLDLENGIQLARRLQDAVEDPVVLGNATLYLTCSLGFILDRQLPRPMTQDLIDGAEAALQEARANGPSCLRAYAPGMKAAHISSSALYADCTLALEEGQIRPWFQPQISCKDGRLTGVEALARWQHPVRGLVPPADFLPALEQAGLLDRLGDRMLSLSLRALADWDREEVTVPCVGVNFSQAELRNPQLLDKISWALDRYEMAPHRLTIEVLESVVSQPGEDMVARNLTRLAQLGCSIDLDDFGTGHASIASVQRFPVHRLKIDRSFVARLDSDPAQQRLVAALLTMGQTLDLKVLAEGVETQAQADQLIAMGCGEMQGYGIARPMPYAETLEWIRKYDSRLDGPTGIGRKTG